MISEIKEKQKNEVQILADCYQIITVNLAIANFCGSHYPLHMSMVEASSRRKIVDQDFLVLKRVLLSKISHHSHQLQVSTK